VVALNVNTTCAWSEDDLQDAFRASKFALLPSQRIKMLVGTGRQLVGDKRDQQETSGFRDDAEQRQRLDTLRRDRFGGCMCATLSLYASWG
jgi:hypothetical protein